MERKYYDLTPAQRLLIISQKATIHKQVNNLPTLVLMDKELNFDILKKAVMKVYERMDSLRLRVVKDKDDKKMKQYFAEYEEPFIKVLDFSGKSFEYMEKKLYKIAHKRVTVFGKSMSKVYLIHSYDGRCGIYFVVSHMILDSWGITTFYRDVLRVYEAMAKGTDMPKPLAPYEPLLVRDLNYETTETYKKDQEFWKSFLGEEEPIFTHVNGSSVLEKYRKKKKNPNLRYGVTFTLFTKNKNVMLPLPKEMVEKMEAFCAANKLPMQALVLLGLRSYFSKVNSKEKDVVIHNAIARRGTLAEKNAGGSVVHSFPFRTIIDENITFKRACEIISERQAGMYKHSNIDYDEIMSIISELYKNPRIGTYLSVLLTYQPVKQVSPSGEQLYTKWYGNGALGIPLYLTVMDGDGTGALKFYYEYQTHSISFETVQKLHSYMIRVFEAGTSNPDITVGELLDI